MNDTIPQDNTPRKRCSKCKEFKSATTEEFKPHLKSTAGLSSWCRECYKTHVHRTYKSKAPQKTCKKCGKSIAHQNKGTRICAACLEENHREKSLKWAYGITQADYDEMFARQFGLCAICGLPPKDGKPLHVDHCHKTGLVRELLCSHCNQMLGYARDSAETLKNAIKYLKRHAG